MLGENSGVPAAEIRVLGPFEIVGSDGPVPLAAKQARLLAALVVEGGRARGVDDLVEAVWGESPPASAEKLVQVYVSQLRRALPAGVEIVTHNGAYAAALPAEALDAARFERLLGECDDARRDGNPGLAAALADRALALWRGRAYGDLGDEEVARAEADRLEELRQRAVEARVDAYLSLGRQGDVLPDVLALAREHPYRERLHELAMLALYRSGRQSEALEHFAEARARLAEDLGLEPGPALRDLQRRILQQDPALGPELAAPLAASQLPLPPNALVGRERELDALRSLLRRRDARLIVLTGAGGSGKTRLALEAAREAASSFANGVVLVELAPLRDAELVVPTIAQACDVSESEDVQLDALATTLATKELLLLVDNAEHVRAAATAFAELVARVPRLTLLVTSRAVLHVSGELVIPVPPLAEDEAVALFVQRARLLDPSFALSPANEADVHEVCRQLDGLPLAVELAAARIRTLTPQALRQRLDARLTVLAGGPRDLPARQQTLRETIAWSVDLLDDATRLVFARMAVFPGGASLEAVESVCGADLDELASLVDDHLVRRDDVDGIPRYRMLETIREYALQLLGETRPAVELEMTAYMTSLVEPDWSALSSAEWVSTLDLELDNLRAALDVAAASDDAELELQLAGRSWRYWYARGSLAAGLDRIESALSRWHGPPTVHLARALVGGAGLAFTRGDLERATTLASEGMRVAVQTAARSEEGQAHRVLGVVASARGDHVQARRHHERSVSLAEELGREPLVEKLNLGNVALDSGEYEAGVELLESVLASCRRNDAKDVMGFALLNLGLARFELGDLAASRRDFEEARAGFEATGIRAQVGHAFQGLALVEAAEARYEEAASLLGRARAELDGAGWVVDDFAPTRVQEVEAQARAALGNETFETNYAAGRDEATV
jgi:predicted ATPase/DNA-binding SARP family transcriptional activator